MDIQDFGKHPLADRSLCQRRCSEWQWIVAPSPREGGGYLTRSADTMSVAAADNASYADGTVVSRRIIASLTEA